MLHEALQDSPAVLIHGPRQCGKTTLARETGDALGYHYITFDDDNQHQAAQTDPMGFVQTLPENVILDEIQRVPELFTSLKATIDKNRQPGRFILTGSANVLLLPKLADSLAGRMEVIRLRPLAQCEIRGQRPAFLPQLFLADFNAGNLHLSRLGESLADTLCQGGYPAAIARRTEKRRNTWYRDYSQALIQRDIRELANIRNLASLPKLLTLSAAQTARLFNVSDLASPFAISRPTIREYLTLLEQIFLIEQLEPWHNNRLSRLIKTPKLHLADTGLACALLGVSRHDLWQDKALLGQMLETFIYQELRKQADWHEQELHFCHYRDKDKVEVDIIIEQGRKLAGIEIKAAATITQSDFKGLKRLKDATGERFAAGVVFYDGDAILPFGERLFAVPISVLVPAIQ
ncbi:putative ATPase, AAA+ superfamily [Alloalcanivorax dieselolei B5]|uniref:Putative ATPase, AAA+ superfamily n=1 Tax=Alcanivorax dieselolei (strain DSM 16502 / CGMCC 1.3690 / MCCC 1A00001 / B-5) TaxID=930169 RepID=K0CJI4_ALCDB|nr:putative ATPase, AAA+ superfamily [Alloalcanivorax dieselolei B5]